MAIDRSATMVARARALNAGAIAEGHARIGRHTLDEVAERGLAFDKVFAVNVNTFWIATTASLTALARLVRPRGAAYLVFEPPGSDRVRALERDLPPALSEAGFTAVEVHKQRDPTARRIALIARCAGTPA